MNISDVRTWIITSATADDMDAIREAMKTRKELLVDEIKKGDFILIKDIRPKYLNGLTGKFHGREEGRGKSRGSVMLDEASTKILRVKGRQRFFIMPSAKEFKLDGLPMTCLSKVN